MVLGVGTDVVCVERARKAFSRREGRLLRRVFSAEEIEQIGDNAQKWQRLAARFAAKEAVMKSLGVGMWQIGFLDIVLGREPCGKPTVSLLGRAAARARQIRVKQVLISMAHEHEYAVAHALALGEAS